MPPHRRVPLTRAGTARPVLVVDDDRGVRATSTDLLGAAGLATITAGDGREALGVLARQSVGLVLLDCHVPVLGGLDTLRAIRADPATAKVPVVLVTADGRVQDRVAGLEAGADDYLVKPVDAAELVARVRAHLRAAPAWARVVDGHVRARDTMATALRRATFARARETIGDVICREVADLPGTGGAAMLAFSRAGDDAAVALAAHGPALTGLGPGALIPRTVAEALIARAVDGPWLDAAGGPLSRHPGGHLGLLPDHGAAYAPLLHGPDDLHGLLVVAAGRERPDGTLRALSSCLATAIDFAALADALLGPLLARHERRAGRRTGLAEVIAASAFHPVFQPIVRLDGVGPAGAVAPDEVVGHELLTRFADGTPPARRFHEAGTEGLGNRLEHATLAAGLAAARASSAARFLAVNVSPGFLVERAGADLLRTAAAPAAGRAGGTSLVLELTEHDRVDDYPSLQRALRELGQGVRLSIDDAGAGYACLTHVLELRPAFVKLDRSWIAGIDGDPTRQALVAGLSHFAGETDCQLVAEGVERPEELATLRRLGVELGQGFLFGRPSSDLHPS